MRRHELVDVLVLEMAGKKSEVNSVNSAGSGLSADVRYCIFGGDERAIEVPSIHVTRFVHQVDVERFLPSWMVFFWIPFVPLPLDEKMINIELN